MSWLTKSTIFDWVGCHPLYKTTNRGFEHCSFDFFFRLSFACKCSEHLMLINLNIISYHTKKDSGDERAKMIFSSKLQASEKAPEVPVAGALRY